MKERRGRRPSGGVEGSGGIKEKLPPRPEVERSVALGRRPRGKGTRGAGNASPLSCCYGRWAMSSRSNRISNINCRTRRRTASSSEGRGGGTVGAAAGAAAGAAGFHALHTRSCPG